ncbi:MAG: hypothetical protein GPJ54_19470 [Candidatus Heimdallarchaeota archaeon]|nr:hypothetical protein [Candidatus Heimdallarchaeota archaeon]
MLNQDFISHNFKNLINPKLLFSKLLFIGEYQLLSHIASHFDNPDVEIVFGVTDQIDTTKISSNKYEIYEINANTNLEELYSKYVDEDTLVCNFIEKFILAVQINLFFNKKNPNTKIFQYTHDPETTEMYRNSGVDSVIVHQRIVANAMSRILVNNMGLTISIRFYPYHFFEHQVKNGGIYHQKQIATLRKKEIEVLAIKKEGSDTIIFNPVSGTLEENDTIFLCINQAKTKLKIKD